MSAHSSWACAKCGNVLNAVTFTGQGTATPASGDVSLCAYCGNLAVFTGHGLELREPTPAELRVFEVDRGIAAARGLLGE